MDDGTSPHGQTSHDRDRNKPGAILGRLSFIKSSKHAAPRPPMADEAEEQDEDARGTSSIASALRQRQGRKRTASLRQAAMALRKERTAVKPPTATTTMSAPSPDAAANPRQMSYENYLSQATFATDTDSVAAIQRPTPPEPYASTTDEDDTASFYGQSVSSSTSSFHATAQSSAMSLSRRRSNRSERRSTPTINEPPPDLDLDDEWDYSETEWWGWVVLIVTWLVFVVGMGSCLGVWSWAWDVGETPYAPPELEDDATLPITGYYPALIVCTGVMSWVWVVVAWVGMKYFRHAKVVGEDG